MDSSKAVLLDSEHVDRLPHKVRFGTSSWTYPGWQGLVYHKPYKSEREFKLKCLSEYCQCPLFRTVGIDSSFYTPLSAPTLERYAAQVPQKFSWVSKVWERITIQKYPAHARYGKFAGAQNPDFLNADLFCEKVLGPYSNPDFKLHCGPMVFQFPTLSKQYLSTANFINQLGNFLSKLPADFRYAIEIRNPELLNQDYFQTLNAHAAAHCFNHWHFMPALKEQMKLAAAAGGLKSDFYVARILTPLGVSYENAVKLFSPYNEIRRPNPEMRADVVRLAKRAIEKDVDAYIIVNNRSEGNSPITIDSILRLMLETD